MGFKHWAVELLLVGIRIEWHDKYANSRACAEAREAHLSCILVSGSMEEKEEFTA